MMSTEARTAPISGRESVESLPPQPYPPQFYPSPNYQGLPQPPWLPGHPPAVSSGPWPAPWGYTGPAPAWSVAQTGGKIASTTSASALPSDEYTVDTMRRIYNDDDGRVEIQRVKVQRRHPELPGAPYPNSPDAMSLVPVGTFPLNERRPPPRKNKIKRQMQLMQSLQGQQGPHPWYPYMPCMPYPYPYPYYYGGCMWPPGIVSPPMTPWPGSDDSERTTSRQESLPTTLDSQRLESRVSAPSRNSLSPSPSAATHSITPSDSVSIFGYKDEESLKLSLRGPTPPPRSKSRALIERRSRALMAPSDAASDSGDKLSVITTSTDIVPYQKLPPKRKKRALKTVSISDKSSTIDLKDIDSLSDRISVTSDMTCDEPSILSSELNYAFRKFEQSVDVFKTKLSVESTPVNTPSQSPLPVIVHSTDTATITEIDTSMTQSENSKLINYSDSNEANSKTLTDSHPLTDSLTSLPQLETAPSESLSTSVPSTNTGEIPVSQNIPYSADVKQEQNLVTINSSINISQPSIHTIPITSGMTDTTNNVPQVQNVPVPSPAQEGSESSTAASDTSTPASQTASVNLQSEPILLPESCVAEPKGESIVKKLETQMDVDISTGRDSRASSSTFFSFRPSDDPLHLDTDSTDILLPTTDATTADEGGEGTDWTASSPVADDNESYRWVLQQPGEIPDLDCSSADREDERRNAWRAEVSLWRARLVVSLCRGRGLDRQDWATFHLLVHHPLTLDLKLSMLHAPRLCVANSTVGAALVRVALIHLAQHGETLLQPEANRQHGWKSIKVDPNQSWSPVKGAVDILKALGYREREDGVLRYPRRSCPEVSVLARLTLDMLVLAEELRLYLTGTHQYPTNISDLFFPASVISPSPVDGSQLTQDLPRPPSSTGSLSFMSARSNTSLNNRPESRASSVTDDDTETLQASVRQLKSHGKKLKQPSSSEEEEVTLIEDIVNKQTASQESNVITQDPIKRAEDRLPPPTSDVIIRDKTSPVPGSTVSLSVSSLLDNQSSSMLSLPDLQSVKSSTISLINQPLQASGSNGSLTPVTTPTPEKEDTKDNPEDHIYEEIDVIRQQVQALRASSVPVDIAPPPLPPKKKVSSGEDDSGLSLTYPHMEWTSSSMPGSLRGGSTGARKKKRRAPMPPDFMPQDWKAYENRPRESPTAGSLRASPVDRNKTRYNEKQSLNPFYEDIESVKEQVRNLNKAYEKKLIDKSAKTEASNPFDQEDFVVSGYVGKNPFYEDIDEDENDTETQKNQSQSAATPSSVEGSNLCAMGSLSELQDESIILRTKRRAPKPPSTPDPANRSLTQSPRPPSSPQPPKHPPKVPPPRPPSSPHPPKSPSSPQPPKSPSSPRPPKSPSSPPPPPPTTPPLNPPVPHAGGIESHKQQSSSNEKAEENGNSAKVEDTTTKPSDPHISVDTDQKQQNDALQSVSKTTKAAQQRLSLQHPTIPSPPPPPKLEDDEDTPSIPKETILNSTASQSSPQSLLDDIPYMDANEIYPEKTMASKPEVPQYEIPELPGKDGIPVAPPLSPSILKQTALLLSGHRSVPFIDDSDLPPDCPPPPPPTSPPASPPETPHVSPPETPHTSPPETPCGSPPASPVTISKVADATAPPTESSGGDQSQSLASFYPPKAENVNETKVNELQHSSTSNDVQIEKNYALKEPEKSLELKDEDKGEAPPLPPKTLQSPKSGLTPKTNTVSSKTEEVQSMQSSMSEDRYEIPDTTLTQLESSGIVNKPTVENETKNDGPNDEKETPEPKEPPAEVAEERYEIPEVVRETALSIGPEGMPIRVGGPSHANRLDLQSVFGPPKPPNRRRRNLSLPPPRPPKSLVLDDNGVPKLPPKAATTGRSASSSTTTSLFTTASSLTTRSPAGTPLSFQLTPKPLYSKPKSKTRRSWPLLFCDCMYANCRNYDEIQKK